MYYKYNIKNFLNKKDRGATRKPSPGCTRLGRLSILLCLATIFFLYVTVYPEISVLKANDVVPLSPDTLDNTFELSGRGTYEGSDLTPSEQGKAVIPAVSIAEPPMELQLPREATISVSMEPVVETKLAGWTTLPKTTDWRTIEVMPGDNMAKIFHREKLSAVTLHHIIHSSDDAARLKHLRPGRKLHLQIENGELLALQYERSSTELLQVNLSEDGYISEYLQREFEIRETNAGGTIHDSLFLAGKRAGLSDNVIMQLIDIYAWDIDFITQVREGDWFRLIYQEHYLDGEKVRDGVILAAEFVNRGKSLRALRHTTADGRTDYYTESGDSMRTEFLRTPVAFSRISSLFNLRRKHPILNTIRAHRGVDYAAPSGTPVKATGDGVVEYAANHGGYGRSVLIQHGSKYTTVYAHLSRYARGIRKGVHVKQGQIIGYVGMTGLATGPHLHYEFRVYGTHRDPLSVTLPKAANIPADALPAFKAETAGLLARLETHSLKPDDEAKPSTLALNKKERDAPATN